MINGPNINNIMIVLSTLSADKLNLIFGFFNAYFNDFVFKLPEYKLEVSYYGCFL